MDTQVVKEVEGKKYNRFGQRIVSCTICGSGTTMLGTELCDGCWELDRRIRADLDIAERLVNFYRAAQR